MFPTLTPFEFIAWTKSDTNPFAYNGLVKNCRAIFVGTAGDLVLQNGLGDKVTFKNVPNATTIWVSAAYVMADTTASNLVALF